MVTLPTPRGIDPPTLVHADGDLNRSLAPLVDTYATVPYADVDPTVLAGLAFMVMFGMMFADAGQGAVLLTGGAAVAGGAAPAAVGGAPDLAVRRRLGGRRHLLRGAVRRVLRPHRRDPDGVDQAAGGTDPAPRGGRGRRSHPAGRGLCAGDREPLARGRVAHRAGGHLRGGRRGTVPGGGPARPRGIRAGPAAGGGRGRRRRRWPGPGLRGPAGRVRGRCGWCHRSRGGAVRRSDPVGHQRRVVRAAGGVRPGPRGPAGDGVAGRPRGCGPLVGC